MIPYGTDANGSPVYIDSDGNVFDSQGQQITDLSSINSYGSLGTDDIALTTSSPAPPVRSATQPSVATADAGGWLSAAGSFGVAIASIISGKPIAVNAQGRPIGAVGTQVNTQLPSSFNVVGLALLGLGVFVIIKLLK